MTNLTQPTAAPPAPKAEIRAPGLIRRLGALLRDRINNPLQTALTEAELLADPTAGHGPEVEAAARAIEEAVRRIATAVADFETLAAELYAARPRRPAAPAQLASALAAELGYLARHAETGPPPELAARLRPRFRRAARLARAWLSSGARLRPSYPAPRTPAPPAGAPTPPRPGTAVAALLDRLGRLEQQLAELRERTARRERFWRFATHELRNAANAFVSWAYVLRRSELRNAPWFAPLVRAAEAVLRRAEEALQLDLAGYTEFPLQLETVDLGEAARTALELVRPLADRQGLSLALASPPANEPVWARADRERLHQVLQNLLQNAIDATAPGGSVCATARYTDDGSASIEIEDTGAWSPTAPPPGPTPAGPPLPHRFGLGLPLSRFFIEQMGGSLEFEPAPPTGTRVVLRLPRTHP